MLLEESEDELEYDDMLPGMGPPGAFAASLPSGSAPGSDVGEGPQSGQILPPAYHPAHEALYSTPFGATVRPYVTCCVLTLAELLYLQRTLNLDPDARDIDFDNGYGEAAWTTNPIYARHPKTGARVRQASFANESII